MCSGGPAVPVPVWHDTNYDRRIPIGLCDDEAPDVAVTNLPVTVILRDAYFDFGLAESDGDDVIFVDHRGGGAGTILPFERSEYRDGYGLFFVRVGSFNPHDLGDAIWLYFDDGSPTDRQSVASTWTDFNGVWHFDDEGNVVREARGAAPSDVGDNCPATCWDDAAPLYGSLDLHPDEVYSRGAFMAGPPAGARVDNGSVSFMVGPNTNSQFGGGHAVVLDRREGYSGFGNYTMHVTLNGDTRVGISRPTNNSGTYLLLSGSGAVPATGFSVVTATWTPSRLELYVNGGSVGGLDHTAAVLVDDDQPDTYEAAQVLMGIASSGAYNLAARLDEIRVSNAARSAAYVRAEARAHLEQLLQFGATEEY